MKKQFGKFILLFIILLTGFAADYFTKQWAVNTIKDRRMKTIVNGFVEISYTENRGMVFGVLNEKASLPKHYILTGLTLISILLIIYIIWRIRRMPFLYHLPFFIILAGAFGNLIDKIKVGHVVDFIHIHFRNILNWPFLFNVADIWICIGGVLLIILILFSPRDFIPFRQK